MKTILFSFATTETAGPSAEVKVPTRKSTLSFRIISRATRTASLASAFESRTMSSIFLPSTPPFAFRSSTNIIAPFDAGSPKSAGGPDSGMGMPTLIAFWASAVEGTAATSASSMVRIRMIMGLSLSRVCSECRQSGHRHPDAVHGRRRRDVEASVVAVAPREVGRVFGREDDAQARALGVEDVDPTRAAAVDVARGIDLHAVGGARAFTHRLRPDAASRHRAVSLHIEDADVLPGGVVDEQAPSIQGEAQAVGPVEIVHEKNRALRISACTVHALERELLLARDSVELGSAIGRIAEVDAPVGRTDDVVRAVELLTLVVSGKR